MDFWNWKNFKKQEIDCNCIECSHELWNKVEYGVAVPQYFINAMNALQNLRDTWGQPINIRSGHRCITHNRKVGGAKNSQHLKLAFDISMPKNQQENFIRMAKLHGFNGIGRYSDFVHLDIRETLTEWEQ